MDRFDAIADRTGHRVHSYNRVRPETPGSETAECQPMCDCAFDKTIDTYYNRTYRGPIANAQQPVKLSVTLVNIVKHERLLRGLSNIQVSVG